MKTTDKIVTSVTAPQSTNVMWHNPETGKLKLFGQMGWEDVGGKSESDSSLGYPIVTVQDDFNITAEPNTFYNVKNDANSEVNINLMDNYSSYKYLFFTCEENDEMDEMFNFLGLIGGVVKSDTSRSGYKYSMDIYIDFGAGDGVIQGTAFFDDMLKTGNTVNYLMASNAWPEMTGKASNITVLNDNEDYFLEVNLNGTLLNGMLIQKDYDAERNLFFYDVCGGLTLFAGINQLMTSGPYQEATEFITVPQNYPLHAMGEVKVKNNKGEKIREIANEFIINVKSPANVTFNEEINWHNDIAPDLTQDCVYTISIVNGVGCYTCINP